MTRKALLAIAFASLCLPVSGSLAAQTPAQNMGAAQTSAANDPAGQNNEAQQMVPAQVILSSDLDAKKLQPGAEFRATLSGKVHLKGGPELSSGSALIGTVATDDLNLNGTAKLALRFTQAQPKNGQAVPIKAMIVGIYPPRGDSSYESVDSVAANSWNPQQLRIDAPNVISGVDLHSKIDSGNSGVLVATRRNDVKLPAGEQIDVAIAVQSPGQMSMNGNH